MSKFTVKKNAENPEKPEILAEAIVRIGEGFQKLKDSGVNETGIIVLLQDCTGLSKRDIKLVLGGLRQLRAWYCRS